MPRLVPAPCLRRAYARGRTARAPPPHPLLPHPPRKGARTARRWRGDMGGGGQRTDRRAKGERRAASGGDIKKKQRTKQTNAPGEESEKTGTKTATTGGRPGRHGPARDAGEEPDLGGMGAPKGKTPPPTAASPCACVVLASCLRHACYKGKTTRATRGMTVAERGPPPGGQRGRVGRQRREGAGRTTRPCPKGARAVQAPTGGPPGVRPRGR